MGPWSPRPRISSSATFSLLLEQLRVFLPAFSVSPSPQLFARSARLRAALGIALGASRGRSLGLMHAECSRRRPTRTEDARVRLPSDALAAATVIGFDALSRTAQGLCMHDSARMTQPARRTRSTTLTRLHVGASYLRAMPRTKYVAGRVRKFRCTDARVLSRSRESSAFLGRRLLCNHVQRCTRSLFKRPIWFLPLITDVKLCKVSLLDSRFW